MTPKRDRPDDIGPPENDREPTTVEPQADRGQAIDSQAPRIDMSAIERFLQRLALNDKILRVKESPARIVGNPVDYIERILEANLSAKALVHCLDADGVIDPMKISVTFQKVLRGIIMVCRDSKYDFHFEALIPDEELEESRRKIVEQYREAVVVEYVNGLIEKHKRDLIQQYQRELIEQYQAQLAILAAEYGVIKEFEAAIYDIGGVVYSPAVAPSASQRRLTQPLRSHGHVVDAIDKAEEPKRRDTVRGLGFGGGKRPSEASKVMIQVPAVSPWGKKRHHTQPFISLETIREAQSMMEQREVPITEDQDVSSETDSSHPPSRHSFNPPGATEAEQLAHMQNRLMQQRLHAEAEFREVFIADYESRFPEKDHDGRGKKRTIFGSFAALIDRVKKTSHSILMRHDSGRESYQSYFGDDDIIAKKERMAVLGNLSLRVAEGQAMETREKKYLPLLKKLAREEGKGISQLLVQIEDCVIYKGGLKTAILESNEESLDDTAAQITHAILRRLCVDLFKMPGNSKLPWLLYFSQDERPELLAEIYNPLYDEVFKYCVNLRDKAAAEHAAAADAPDAGDAGDAPVPPAPEAAPFPIASFVRLPANDLPAEEEGGPSLNDELREIRALYEESNASPEQPQGVPDAPEDPSRKPDLTDLTDEELELLQTTGLVQVGPWRIENNFGELVYTHDDGHVDSVRLYGAAEPAQDNQGAAESPQPDPGMTGDVVVMSAPAVSFEDEATAVQANPLATTVRLVESERAEYHEAALPPSPVPDAPPADKIILTPDLLKDVTEVQPGMKSDRPKLEDLDEENRDKLLHTGEVRVGQWNITYDMRARTFCFKHDDGRVDWEIPLIAGRPPSVRPPVPALMHEAIPVTQREGQPSPLAQVLAETPQPPQIISEPLRVDDQPLAPDERTVQRRFPAVPPPAPAKKSWFGRHGRIFTALSVAAAVALGSGVGIYKAATGGPDEPVPQTSSIDDGKKTPPAPTAEVKSTPTANPAEVKTPPDQTQHEVKDTTKVAEILAFATYELGSASGSETFTGTADMFIGSSDATAFRDPVAPGKAVPAPAEGISEQKAAELLLKIYDENKGRLESGTLKLIAEHETILRDLATSVSYSSFQHKHKWMDRNGPNGGRNLVLAFRRIMKFAYGDDASRAEKDSTILMLKIGSHVNDKSERMAQAVMLEKSAGQDVPAAPGQNPQPSPNRQLNPSHDPGVDGGKTGMNDFTTPDIKFGEIAIDPSELQELAELEAKTASAEMQITAIPIILSSSSRKRRGGRRHLTGPRGINRRQNHLRLVRKEEDLSTSSLSAKQRLDKELAEIDKGWDEITVAPPVTARNKLDAELAEIDRGWDDINVTSRAAKTRLDKELEEIDKGWDVEPAKESVDPLKEKIEAVKKNRTAALMERGEVFVPSLSEDMDGSVLLAIKNGFMKECFTGAQMNKVEALVSRLRLRDLVEYEVTDNGTFGKLTDGKLAELRKAVGADDETPEITIEEIDADWPEAENVPDVRTVVQSKIQLLYGETEKAA